MKRNLLVAGAFAALALSACQEAESPVQPLVPPEPPANPAIVSASWIFDVRGDLGEVHVYEPTSTFDESAQILADYFGLEASGPDLSILAGDVIEVLADDATLAFSPVVGGQREATFDIAIRNRLAVVNLIQPTFPAPPAGTSGIILFPFETVLIDVNNESVTGGQGDGTEVIVEAPNEGLVAPSASWDGPPTNFFNDDPNCSDNDCYRYEEYVAPLVGGTTSEYNTVGFDQDATVSRFRFRAIVAADLENSTPNVLPTADAGGPYSAEIPNSATLSGAASSDPDGTIAAYDWDLDNNGAFDDASGVTVPFQCTTDGTFAIGLRVTDDRGGQATATSTVVCDPATENASVSLGSNVSSVTEGDAVVFTVTADETTTVVGIAGVAIDVTITGGTIASAPGGAISGSTVSYTGINLVAGGQFTADITVTAGAATEGSVDADATLTAATDSNAGDNTATASATIGIPANVFGVWATSANGGTTFTEVTGPVAAGSQVYLLVCVAGDVVAYTTEVSYDGATATADNTGANFNSAFQGVGACAAGSPANDQLETWIPGPGLNPVVGSGFTSVGSDTGGVQGIVAIPLTLAATATGSFLPTVDFPSFSTQADGSGSAPFSVDLAPLTIN